MKHYYCTYFDRNYLVKALALFRSLEQHEKQNYVVFAVCLDEITRVILESLHLPHIELIPLHLIEKSDNALLSAKQNRTLIEYYWTLTPAVVTHILERNPEIGMITYLDADVFFYSSPSPLFEEMSDNSILVHEHRFCPSLSSLEHGNGRFNVGLIVFRNDAVGRATIAWWRERCIEWCYLRIEDGKMGDQMYLNEWPERFGSVHVLEHIGGGVAPWNHEQYAICTDGSGSVTIDGFPLIFYHFHALVFAEPDIIIPAQHIHYPLNTDVLRYCYLPYLYALDDAINTVRNVSDGFMLGLLGQVPNIKQTFLCKHHRNNRYGDVSATHSKISLDDRWDCFCTEQFTPSATPEESELLWAPGRQVRSCDDLFLELEGMEISREIKVLYIIGAHLFQESKLIDRMFPRIEKIYLFEAIPQLCQILREMVASDPRIEVFSYAISDRDEDSVFHITDNSGESSSLLPLAKHLDLFPHVHELNVIPVECRTIESVIRQHRLRQPDMLFIDVQGAEYRILSSLTPELKKNIKLIYTEASHEELYLGARPLADIILLLKESFRFLGFAPLFNNTPTHGNALFVNHSNRVDIRKGTHPAVQQQKSTEPVISVIVSTYNSEEFMRECLEDLVNQTIFGQMEVIVVDAASPQNEQAIIREFQQRYSNIRYIRTPERIGIYAAWNIAIREAKGKYIAPFSTNDRLRRDAYQILKTALDNNPDIMLVYGDTYLTKIPHETFDNHTCSGVFKWPDYSFEYLLCACMVGPHPMWRKGVHEKIGYFDESYIAIGDQEFWLRMGEHFSLLHIPEFTGLYWISEDALSTQAAYETEGIHQKYQARYLARVAEASTHRRLEVCQETIGKQDKTSLPVSIIIPLFNNMSYTRRCLEQLRKNTPAELYELILVDNGSTDDTYTLFNDLPPPVKVIRNLKNQGFARACNQGAEAATGKYLLFLNNDTESQPGWLEPLFNTAERDTGVAAVGSKLLFPDGTIQHAGVVIVDDRVTPDSLLGRHIYQGFPVEHPAANTTREYKALTAACLLVRREVFEAVQGFDEGYWNGYEDVDLCFKLGQKGWKLIYQPASVVVHHESKSGSERFARAAQNIARLHEKWLGTIKPDVIIHPDLREEWLMNLTSGTISPAPHVSIIIPLFNQAKLTKACVEAIRGTAGDPGRYELILLDNGSDDWTPEYLNTLSGSATILTNSVNAGFAKGCNRAAKSAKGEYLLFLNNDTLPQSGWLDALLAGKKNDGADIVGAKLLYPDGRVQHAGVAFKRNGIGYHLFRDFPGDAPAVNKKRFMQCVTAACMLVSKQLFSELGGFDEQFCNGFEDMDFCLRAGLVGKRVLYTPDAVVIHLEGQSEGRKQRDNENMQRFLTIWQGRVACDEEELHSAAGYSVEWLSDGTCLLRPHSLLQKKDENSRYPLISLVGHSSSSILQKLSTSQRTKSVLKRYTVDD